MTRSGMLDDALFAELSALYAAPGRHYHGLAHVQALLGLAREYEALLDDTEAVEAAIWFHDAVYDSRAADNEARSAALALDRLDGRAAPGRLSLVEAMILATASHVVPELAHPAAKRDAALFLDMDLSILGAPPEAFDAYEAAVRQEYGWVPDQAWRKGRGEVLARFIGRERIFHTAIFVARFEAAARRNIARSLDRLSS